MKKQAWFIIFSLILLPILILPAVNATITINGPSKSIYNIGDKLDIKVEILGTQEIHGLLKLELNCETSSPLLLKTINTEANKVYSLQENIPVQSFLTGSCSILASIQIGGTLADQSQSKAFTISNELLSNIEIDKTQAQTGEKILLSGTISKQDNTLLEGVANLYFKNNENLVSMETLTIKKGILNYEFDTTSKPAGIYTIQIESSDIYGNKYSSSDLTFEIIDKLTLELQLDKTETLPDSTIKLTGVVKDIENNLVKEGKAVISMEDKLYTADISRGSFSQKIEIPETIKSNQHTIHVKVEDSFGNTAEKDIQFSVIPVPTALEIQTSETSLKPESNFIITAAVYDQGAELVDEKTKLEVVSPKNERVLEKEVSNEEEINLEIPQSASPGLWTITGMAAGLKTRKQITVQEVSSFNAEIDGQLLKITNTGNINYKEPIPITFKNEKETTTRELSSGFFGIKPTAFAVYDLGKYVKTGTYDISVNAQDFSGISIVKRFVFSLFYLIPIAILLIFFIFLFLKRNAKISKQEDKNFQKGKEAGEQIRSQKMPLTDAELKEKYRKEFIGHMVKKVEERNQEVKKNLKFDFSPKKVPQSFASVKLPRNAQASRGYIQSSYSQPDYSQPGYSQKASQETGSSIMSVLQKPENKESQPLWRILRKKGLAKGLEKEKKEFKPKDPNLFNMFN